MIQLPQFLNGGNPSLPIVSRALSIHKTGIDGINHMLVQARTIIKFENGGTNLDRYKSHILRNCPNNKLLFSNRYCLIQMAKSMELAFNKITSKGSTPLASSTKCPKLNYLKYMTSSTLDNKV
ncbi:hypothetical protein LXL04_001801 [Taraxacum kok-saghyz]